MMVSYDQVLYGSLQVLRSIRCTDQNTHPARVQEKVHAAWERAFLQNASQARFIVQWHMKSGEIRCMEIQVMHEKCFTISYSEENLQK